jgi:putative ABC transport system ATP-binding protein
MTSTSTATPLGFVFRFYNLVEDLTIRENIEVCQYISKDPLEVDGLLRSLGSGSSATSSPRRSPAASSAAPSGARS